MKHGTHPAESALKYVAILSILATIGLSKGCGVQRGDKDIPADSTKGSLLLIAKTATLLVQKHVAICGIDTIGEFIDMAEHNAIVNKIESKHWLTDGWGRPLQWDKLPTSERDTCVITVTSHGRDTKTSLDNITLKMRASSDCSLIYEIKQIITYTHAE